MSKGEMLRALMKQRITAAAEEISGLFERTIAEYEEELCRSKEENKRQQKLLEAAYNPQLQLHGADVQQPLVHKEEVPSEQQGWSSSLDQEDLDLPQIKEEQEELWTSEEGEQLPGLEEADLTNFPFTPPENPESSQLHQRRTEQMKTEADEEDCQGPEPVRNLDPDSHLLSDTEHRSGDFSEPETDDSGDWNETGEPQSGFKSLKTVNMPDGEIRCRTVEKLFSCSMCEKRFGSKTHLMRHIRSHTGEKPFSCSVCGKGFVQKPHLNTHMITHTGEKPFSCSVCKKCFTQRGYLQLHMKKHTGEEPYSCPVCGKGFTISGNLTQHIRIHTGEKPFSCSVCSKGFTESGNLEKHMRIHTGEKPYSCSVCGKCFPQNRYLKIHMMTHTGQTPFNCSVCDKRFKRNASLKNHMKNHTG